MKIKEFILKVFFPPRCVGCNTVTENGADLCENCRELLCEAAIDQQNACRLCGLPKKLCTCKKHAREFDAIVSPFIYDGIIRNAVKELKIHANSQPVDFFARHIASAVIKAGFENIDAVTAVPTTKKEFKSRGYSPAKLIAVSVAEKLGIPFDGSLIRKVYETRPQKELPKFMRRGNIFGVFEADKETAENKIILIIDDVTTTGSTLNECAKMLNFAGAFKVYCAVAAKTVLKPKEQDKKQAEKKQKANRRKDADSKTGIEKSDQNSKQSEQYDDGSLENVQSDEYDEHGKHDDYDDYDDLEDYEYSPEELEYIKQQSNLDRVDIESIAVNVQNEYDNTESVPNGFEDTEGDGRRGFEAILNSDETLTITSKEKR